MAHEVRSSEVKVFKGKAACADSAFHSSLWFSSLYLNNLPHLSAACLFRIPSAVVPFLSLSHTHTHTHHLKIKNLLSLCGKMYKKTQLHRHRFGHGGVLQTGWFFIFIGIHMVCCTVGSFERPTCRVRQPQ